MKLTWKLLIISGAALLVLATILFSIARGVLTTSFLNLEHKEATESILKSANIITYEFSTIDLTLRDWSQWDETYEFAMGNRPHYVSDNFKPLSLSVIDINFVVVYDKSGRAFFRRAVSHAPTVAPLPITASEWRRFDAELQRLIREKKSATGVIFLAGKPYIAGIRPILNTDGNKPPAGAFIMGRELDTAKADDLSQKLTTPISFFPLSQNNLPPDVRKARLMLSRTSEKAVAFPLDSTVIAGYSTLNDIAGHPSLIVRCFEKRDIYSERKRFMRYLLVSSVSAGLIFTMIALVFINFNIARPLSTLIHEITGIKSAGGTSRRIPVQWGGDLGDLATSINALLVSLEKSSAELRRGEQRFRSVVEDQPEIICRFGLDGSLTFTNSACDRFIEWLAGAGPGCNEPIDMQNPAILDAVTHVASISTARPVVEFEEEFNPGRGASKWISFICRGILDDTGRICEYQLMGRDVTARKNAESALEAARKFASIAQLSLGLTHEIKNPLAIIQAHVETLQENEHIEAAPDNKIAYSLDVIAHQASRVIDILSRFSTTARDSAPAPATANLAERITAVISELSPALKHKRAVCETSFPDGLGITIETDWRRVESILSNLIVNASESMHEGGAIRVEAALTRNGKYAEITVSDKGKGIPESELERIFDPFFTTKPQGMGIGLYLCRHYAAQLHGDITIKSRPGEGTTATLSIPVK